MRSREEIADQYNQAPDFEKGNLSKTLMLELLADIRDLIQTTTREVK